ncbi:MAG: hypothetical protein LN561_05235 [Rickettsia endosymbiont of Labidopullus appendiculatus]|nr:hypothetical protein [Rickettsia endosymbiont of Labidopullus appendiculatus]
MANPKLEMDCHATYAGSLIYAFSTIVNSGEFGARSDGATPISNRRATE